MRFLSVALLSWEYPPAVVGGLSRHVYELAGGLASHGHRVTVYTGAHDGPDAERAGVRVVRAPEMRPEIPFRDLVPWVLAFNLSLVERASSDVVASPPDVIHAHDWLVAHAASTLRELSGAPVVATIHATEHGRHAGRVGGPVQRFVDGVERRLTAEAAGVITCSRFMREEVTRVLGAARDKVVVIPNEVGAMGDAPKGSRRRTRTQLGVDGHPLVLFAGRLEYEKGVQTLIDALPILDRSAPGVRVVIAGAGSYRDELERRVRARRLGRRVRFTGFVDERRLRRLYAAADAVVVPSLYEPFGLVAIEAMAACAPVVAADTGGLREIVEHGATGLLFAPGNARSLAAAVRKILVDVDVAGRLSAAALDALGTRGTWSDVAVRTSEAYERALVRTSSAT